MDLYVIRRPGAWANPGELQATAAKSAKVGNEQMSDQVRWIRSYVVKEADGRLGTVCIYEASDSVRRSASMRVASACPATRSFRFSTRSSSATTRRRPMPDRPLKEGVKP